MFSTRMPAATLRLEAAAVGRRVIPPMLFPLIVVVPNACERIPERIEFAATPAEVNVVEIFPVADWLPMTLLVMFAVPVPPRRIPESNPTVAAPAEEVVILISDI